MLVNVRIGFNPSATVNASSTPKVPYHLGNWTYMSKPVFPAKINASQIPIGRNWTYVYNLRQGSMYHVYFYGDWIGTLTDYDIYVYDPNGNLETLHTEAAGLPEHLGTTVEEPFFQPEHSGNYSFLIMNDLRESKGAAAATLMLIEDVECNRWHEQFLEGKVNFLHVYNTTWAYEFSTNSSRVEVWIDVPDTLDMYEARLYVMADPAKKMGSFLNGIPLAWESSLYGNLDTSKLYGGYNMNDDGFKIQKATASCEYYGKDMLINYTSTLKGDTVLYHLVLIGEYGKGTLKFMVKTDFTPPAIKILNPLQTVVSGNETIITANITDQDSLKSVMLNYTDNDWQTFNSTQMNRVVNQTYAGTIPAQNAGTIINYVVVASDMAGNMATAQENYVVKDLTNLTMSLSKSMYYINERIVVTGQMSIGDVLLMLNYTCSNQKVSRRIVVYQNGSFADRYMPDKLGNWTVIASWPGDETHFNITSDQKRFTVQKVPTSLNCTLSNEALDLGGKITIRGNVLPTNTNKAIELEFTMPNSTLMRRYVYSDLNGIFNFDFVPNLPGTWKVQAKLSGDNVYLPSTSESRQFIVNDTILNIIVSFLTTYFIYIIAAAGGTAGAVGFFIYWRRRGG
jgi:hypothetical protein